MQTYLKNIAPHSRTWIYQADRFLTLNEIEYVRNELREFIHGWASHGNALYGDFEVIDKLFIAIGADESKSPTSGCSIDSLTHKIKAIGAVLNIDFFNRLAIAYQHPTGHIDIVSMTEFKDLYSQGIINQDTIVFNNLIDNRADLENKWRTVVKNSWHVNIFQTA